ncbi:2,3-bisphosphoglycerate-dependent phosphoglycerate mutase [Pseudomonas sp. MWU13-2105]|uniref:2,3-bisphosphoglycerate-dependent phosphoglycerate mutase n=1 Tax=Pseudomonas sp. MWU13-2105 TaxID=2935074 RepID=UPI00200CFBBC|nr:2,3-bisphosphoglycerate-dependent phosphoglycerate mutase [Pseudomonas sp. MWU13-2105]
MSRLFLVRHGQSIWNLQDRFTGWVDVSLSQQGVIEAQQAGALLSNEHFDVAFTSTLLRAQDSLYEILRRNRHCAQYVRVHEQSSEWYEHFVPTDGDANELKIHVSEKLNERYYGDLQGLQKDWASQHYGAEQVHLWRRSYDAPPPNGESLQMTAARTLPYYQARIVPHLQNGESVLIAAHGNSLRSIIMHIEQMTPQQIIDYELATGVPHLYTFDNDLRLVDKLIVSKAGQ